MGLSVKVWSGSQQTDIRLWFRMVVNLNRVLNPNDGRCPKPEVEQLALPAYAGGVPTADRSHLDDFPIEQFDTVILRKDTCLGHAMEVVDRETVRRKLNAHDLKSRLFAGFRQRF